MTWYDMLVNLLLQFRCGRKTGGGFGGGKVGIRFRRGGFGQVVVWQNTTKVGFKDWQ